MSIHPEQRRELGARLRTLREAREMSTRQLAVALGASQSKVSRIDRGVTWAKPAEVRRWVEVVGASPEEGAALVALAEDAAIRFTEWRRELAPGRRTVQERIGATEAAASVQRVFGMDVIPGLAQTAAYVEVMFRLGGEHVVDEDIAAVVQARVSRQTVLQDEAKRFRLLCTEAAFRRNLLDRGQMLDQVEHVLQLAERANVDFGVIPFRTREWTHTYHAFAVIGDPSDDDGAIVLAETVTRGMTIRTEEEVADYIAHFEDLAKQAITSEDLPAYLREVAGDAPWS
jgi:transcriptional regulator with XRE-family HTH domain